ncbi:hypothetical protein F3Y22_tig00001713pilonHSYRG00133 [Hibiscus syriacus]|uniref:Disease resistance R13L4/SHOC-2-like LRR domain-containing protein n=1 Tax=Hibiscus syriacus TaxID=106335 RepID=A0A6A3D0J7_HIBSY|nr:hypothetical protein F3Y22_tig00001713pilonHSYRG00133 [Hibiscus syriacus]
MYRLTTPTVCAIFGLVHIMANIKLPTVDAYGSRDIFILSSSLLGLILEDNLALIGRGVKIGLQSYMLNRDKIFFNDLGDANLSGQLVPQLGQLANLQYLELYNNNISGTIPEELGNLTSLVSLDLFSNALTGPIPASLGKLRKLRFLRLNNNSLTGQIPMSLATIDSLQVLNLSNNRLEGDIPVNGSFSLFNPISFKNNGLNNPPVAPQSPVIPSTASTSSDIS